jgi:hypothetical protein
MLMKSEMKARWKTDEEWMKYGIENNYQERNPKSFYKSNDSEERSWYRRGIYKGWLKDFPFKKIRECKSPWQTIEEWREEGYKNDYFGRNPNNLKKSEDKGERSWYARGNGEGWLKDFPFDKFIERWSEFKGWRDYGFEKEYYKRNPTSLSRSENKEERSWYNKGNWKRWLKDFPFKRKFRWHTKEEWYEFGLQVGYNNRSPSSILESEDIEGRAWYAKGIWKGWVRGFPFRRLNSNHRGRQKLENLLESYIDDGGRDA